MTKLVRKLKQMAKKRAHRKAVQKRKIEREQRDYEREQIVASHTLEREVDEEIARLKHQEISNEPSSIGNADVIEEESLTDNSNKRNNSSKNSLLSSIRVAGDLVLNIQPRKQSKKQLSRKQVRRREKLQVRGEAINDTLCRKWDHKRRRVKVRAQIRNEDLHIE